MLKYYKGVLSGSELLACMVQSYHFSSICGQSLLLCISVDHGARQK